MHASAVTAKRGGAAEPTFLERQLSLFHQLHCHLDKLIKLFAITTHSSNAEDEHVDVCLQGHAVTLNYTPDQCQSATAAESVGLCLQVGQGQ